MIKNIFGFGNPGEIEKFITEGAAILDVRTKAEYSRGHINGSVNIPLDSLNSNLKKVKKMNMIITCCESGMRSSVAKRILKSNGITEVYNGGSWMKLQNKINNLKNRNGSKR